MDPVDEEKTLASLIQVDVERRSEDAAERLKDLEKETHIMLWQFLGGRLEDRIRRHEEASVDGVPAIEVDGFYFWAPKGNRGGLQVWARSAESPTAAAEWVSTIRLADLHGLTPGQEPVAK
ncbi:MAG: hypothetical protein IPG72_16005 [Ardenticatenales bacterium]|jgi:hypothetical protein|nr:hypothetical protein [Ardenticatenales bacterium]